MKKMIFLAKLLVLRPFLVLLFISVISITCIILAVLLKPTPDFSDPTLGFEARGTDISMKLTTWRNLLEETRPSGSFIVNPKEIQQHEMFQKKRKNKEGRHNRKNKLKYSKKMKILKNFVKNKSYNVDIAYTDETGNDTTVEEHSHYDYGTNKTYNEELENKRKKIKTEKWKNLKNVEPPPMTSTDFHSTDGFFCESPSKLSK